LDLSQMTSDQKFEHARSLHDFLLSQVESGNPAYEMGDQIASSTDNPNIALLGLDTLKPGDKDAMIKWLEDFQRQSNVFTNPGALSDPSAASSAMGL